MYKSKEKQKEAEREWVRQKRARVRQVPYIVKVLTDPVKRERLERISEGLNRKGLGESVRYGVYGPDFTVVEKLLEVTR